MEWGMICMLYETCTSNEWTDVYTSPMVTTVQLCCTLVQTLAFLSITLHSDNCILNHQDTYIHTYIHTYIQTLAEMRCRICCLSLRLSAVMNVPWRDKHSIYMIV